MGVGDKTAFTILGVVIALALVLGKEQVFKTPPQVATTTIAIAEEATDCAAQKGIFSVDAQADSVVYCEVGTGDCTFNDGRVVHLLSDDRTHWDASKLEHNVTLNCTIPAKRAWSYTIKAN